MVDILQNLQNEVNRYCSVRSFEKRWKQWKEKGAGAFYALTYDAILDFFRKHQRLSDALNLKVALVFSWNPTICEVTDKRFEQAKNELKSLESSVQQELNAKSILDVDLEWAISKLWGPVKVATSKQDASPSVSATKFLHFSFPHIFPMIDSSTMHRLGGKSVNQHWYSEFLLAWKKVYGDRRVYFDQISSVMNMPVARAVDVMIFEPHGRSRRQ
jgi:hypothetical protein